MRGMYAKYMAIGALAAVALSVAWLAFRIAPESSPAARGARLAYLQNCIECHGQIEDSALAGRNLECPAHGEGVAPRHYRGACRDFLAYFEIVVLNRGFAQRQAAVVPNRLLQGEILARQYGCFLCHGQLGQGGIRNAGALKGYIPGYFGEDFDVLTRNGSEESITAWIRHGTDPALVESGITGRIARFYLERQAVKMPRFDSLPDDDIQRLAEYVIVLHEYGEMGAIEIRDYGRQTMLPATIVAADRRLPSP